MTQQNTNLIVVLGPTASGKTTFAVNLAYCLKSEIISADSRQIYKEMNLGTGKDLIDYTIHNENIPYYLIDILDAGCKYNVYEYQRDFVTVFKNLTEKNMVPILCGGTGMYIEAVLKNYNLVEVPINEELRTRLDIFSDAELIKILAEKKPLHNVSDTTIRERTIRAIEIADFHENNSKNISEKPQINPIIFGIRYNRDIERINITQRLQQRLEDGMIKEVELLLKNGVNATNLMYYGLEYKFLTLHVTGEISYKEMFEKLNTAIHQFAKRQMTWFRKMEKNGAKIHWIDGSETTKNKIEIAQKILLETNLRFSRNFIP